MPHKYTINQFAVSLFSRSAQSLAISELGEKARSSRTFARIFKVDASTILAGLNAADLFHDLNIIDSLRGAIGLIPNSEGLRREVVVALLEAFECDIYGEYAKALDLYGGITTSLSSLEQSGLGKAIEFIHNKRGAILVRCGKHVPCPRANNKKPGGNEIDAMIQKAGYDFVHDCFRHNVSWDRYLPGIMGTSGLVPPKTAEILGALILECDALSETQRILKMAILLRKQGHIAQANALLRELQRNCEELYEQCIARINEAVNHRTNGRSTEAQSILRHVIREHGTTEDDGMMYLMAIAHNNLGLLQLANGKVESAKTNFGQSVERLEKLNDEHALSLLKTNELYSAALQKEGAVYAVESAEHVRFIVTNDIWEEIAIVRGMSEHGLVRLDKDSHVLLGSAFEKLPEHNPRICEALSVV